MAPEDDFTVKLDEEEPSPEGEMMAAEPPPEETPVAEGPPVEPTEPERPEPMENLVHRLSVATLRKIADRVCMDAEADYKSSESWRQKVADSYKLYHGDANDSIPNQKNLTIAHLPYVRRASRMFHSKMFPQLIPPTKELFALSVGGTALQDTADRCAAYGNEQLYNLIPEYIPNHDCGMTQDSIEGFMVERFKFDPVLGRPVHQIALAEDFWLPYKSKIVRPDMSEAPRMTFRERMHQHELEMQEAAGYYAFVSTGKKDKTGEIMPLFPPEQAYGEDGAPKLSPMPQGDYLDDRPIKDQGDRVTGQEVQDPNPDGEWEILEQHRWLKLTELGDTAPRPVTVCVDRRSRAILRLSYREREDLQDKLRFMREDAERSMAIESNRAIDESNMMAWQGQIQQEQAAHDEIAQRAVATGLDPASVPPYEPSIPQPEPTPEPPPTRPVKMVPDWEWTKYDWSMNPQGALGHGLPFDVAGHNQLANKVATRAISQMTLAMLPTGIFSRQSKFNRGEEQLKLGEFNESPMSPTQVQAGAGLFLLNFPPPDPNWYKAVEMADASCQEVTAFDIAAGAPGMSGETATEAEMRHSNATDNISEVAARYNRSRAYAIKRLFYINSITLPPEGAVVYRDGTEIRVTREDFELILAEMEVIFTCDPNLESKSVKAKKAERLFGTISQLGSTGAIDPMTNIMLMRAAGAMLLKASDAPKEWVDAITAAPMPMMGPPEGEANGEPGSGNGKGPKSAPVGQGGSGISSDTGGPVAPAGTGGPPQ